MYVLVQTQSALSLDKVLYKSVRSKDLVSVGSITRVEKDAINIVEGPGRHFRVPKSHIQSLTGSEIVLDITFRDLLKYKVMF
jgi:hypothetical protein